MLVSYMGNNVGFLYKMLTISCVTLEYAEPTKFPRTYPPALPLCGHLRSIDCQSIAQHLHLSIAAIDFEYPCCCNPVSTVVYLQKLLGHTNLRQIVL